MVVERWFVRQAREAAVWSARRAPAAGSSVAVAANMSWLRLALVARHRVSMCSRTVLFTGQCYWPLTANTSLLAPGIVGAVRSKKKDSHTKHKRATQATVSSLDEELGQFSGTVTAFHGQLVEIALNDGRVVKCKRTGKLSRTARLKLTDAVCVQYDLEMDEDDQVPLITGRYSAAVALEHALEYKD